jgi:hypothetical protein
LVHFSGAYAVATLNDLVELLCTHQTYLEAVGTAQKATVGRLRLHQPSRDWAFDALAEAAYQQLAVPSGLRTSALGTLTLKGDLVTKRTGFLRALNV